MREIPPVLVVDHDPQIRDSIAQLLRSLGMDAQLFASISDFLKPDKPDGPTCLALDVRCRGEVVGPCRCSRMPAASRSIGCHSGRAGQLSQQALRDVVRFLGKR
jgi:CheY-like chemotaxis protein